MHFIEKNKLSALVREGRTRKGITQQELSDLSGISLRSVQRIENGEVIPRAHTLRVLSEKLDIAELTAVAREPNAVVKSSLSKTQQWIISIGIGLLLILSSLAFIFQSPTFPETSFEGLLLWTGVLAVYMAMLYRIWKYQ